MYVAILSHNLDSITLSSQCQRKKKANKTNFVDVGERFAFPVGIFSQRISLLIITCFVKVLQPH